MVVLPFNPQYAEFTENVILDKKVYSFRFMWNVRYSYWSMSIADSTGPIASGIKVVMGSQLLYPHGDPRLPPGDLMPIPNDNDGKEIDRNNVGTAVSIVYLSEADLAAV